MKVLIVNNMMPFIWGGDEDLAVHLKKNLILAGHEAEILRIPFQREPTTRIASQMLMVRAFELSNVDHVIALKFPAYLIRHPRKTLWLLHQCRQAYDLFDVAQTNLPKTLEGEALRKTICCADNESFLESRYIFTNSKVTQQRLNKYNGFKAEILLPPTNDPELFIGNPSEGYIFAGGRVNKMKRQHLFIEALAKTNKAVRLIIAGPPDTAKDAEELQALAKRLNVLDRVKFDLRFLSRQQYADYVCRAAAVAYIPFDEDSLGYVTTEGATAGKALITTTDSGGVLELVKNGDTGWVAEPSVESLANVMNAAYLNSSRTKCYGLAAKALWESMVVTWPNIMEKLLQ